ncbi:Crp/Fnr family transcriptional regulator [Ramlibacter tataouinensis]|uniref:Crp/Fnr family transcriptional regulator n=1 Tax=Ramlibacter tataouinensis TaxID=94132 RepID=A0A140HLC2_9BURK|nr:Crp/Fnr family transcriptional regulator [Ramlibacter tataouinensis]
MPHVLAEEARSNRVLASLPEPVWQQWQALLEFVEVPSGTVLYEPGDVLHYVYFPANCVVSLMHVLADGASAQIAVVGAEGIVGVPGFMGGGISRTRSQLQSGGLAARLPAEVVATEFERGGAVMRLLLRHTQALIAQMSQIAVCNRHHSPEQQICRWLLLALDRVEGPEVRATQELIASMLGVRRETVTEAARRLQTRGVIQSRRGHIQVLDRGALEHSACECYGAIRKEYARLLPPPLHII